MCVLSTFSERLNDLMIDKGSTVDELSKFIDYPKSEIYHWRAGDYMPSLKNLIALANYFHCTIDFLVGRESENQATSFKKCLPFSEQFPLVVENAGSNFNRIIKATKISSSTIYGWKNGKFTPQLENLIKVADALGCTLDHLVGRE